MKLSLKIILPILLLLTVILGAFGYIFFNLKQQEVVIFAQGTKIQKLNSLNERLARQQEQTEHGVLDYEFNQNKALLSAISQADLDESKTLDEMSPFITTTKGRELVSSYIDSRKEIVSLRNGLIKAIDGGDKEQINLNHNKWDIQIENIKAALSDIKAYNINSLETTLATVNDIGNKITQVIIILAFVAIAIVIFLYFYLRVVITTPIVRLAAIADQLAKTDFTTTTTTTTTGIDSNDEIGQLARAFNKMVEKLKESYGSLEEKVRERTITLAEAKAKDEAILASIGDGMVVVDKEGKITYVNQAFEEIVGWKTQEVLGKYVVEVVPREDEKGDAVLFKERILQKVLSGEKVIVNMVDPFYYICRDKSRFPAISIITPIVLEGKIIGAVETFRDITKEKNIDKAKTEFVSLASHQLRTPLSTVNWYTEMLLAGDVGKVTPEQRKYLDEVYRSNQRMVALVNALLNVSRLELGVFVVEPEPTDVVKLAQSVIDEQKPQIDEKKIKFSPSFENNIPLMQADPKLLRMVVQNLLSNAVKFTPEKGIINLSLKKDGKNMLISIADNGYGIPKNQQDKIFTKLFRADNVREKDTEGTGLGLYIIKSIVEQSGGKIWFESEENKGSIFYVALPLEGMKKKEGTKFLS